MYILGISCFYHDSAACLMKDGDIVAAVQEERFTRKKHDFSFPIHSVKYCLAAAGIGIDDVAYVGFYEKPLIKFERILTTYLATWPRSFPSFVKAIPLWLHEKLWIPQIIRKELNYKGEILYIDHHLSHAASSYLVSGFDSSAILTMDGVGEWETATCGVGRGNDIELLKEIRFPHSLGLLYSAFTYYLGFRVNSGEYKVMGLAPYGKPRFYDLIMDRLIKVRPDGSFKMDMRYFAYDYGLRMTNRRFHRLFGRPPRKPESNLESFDEDVAASIQKVTEEIVLRMVKNLHAQTGMKRICMAGGVALNCVANGRVIRETPFKEIFVQPAAGDAGGAVGVAAYIYHSLLGNKRGPGMRHAFLGPAYSNEDIKRYLIENDIIYSEQDRAELVKFAAKLIADQKVIGWFQGRIEFGPRALGARSILADPRNPNAKNIVNAKIKFREEFRPFAPTVLSEKCGEYFELDLPSPFMLLVAQVRKDKRFMPSITHVDGSARIQTISREESPLYYDLVNEFYKITGCPVVLNTSFNLRGEPLVLSPHDAFLCFMRSGLDYLVMGNFILDKAKMAPFKESLDWRSQFELD
jgi:carbamoyltransferase